jgi:hypothetical protein
VKPFEGRLHAGKRTVIVVAVFAAAALSMGAGVVVAGATDGGISVRVNGPVPRAQRRLERRAGAKVIVGHSYHNDTSLPLRVLPAKPLGRAARRRRARTRARSPSTRTPPTRPARRAVRPEHAGTTLNFDGIPFPGVACNCAPPDTNGEVGSTQYVQIVNEGLQVFNKATGASMLGPVSIVSLWNGFGGVCASAGDGDPVVLYDQLADRWVVTQFAGTNVPTDECIAVSQTSDATGAWYRYGFHLGSNFFDYPHLGVWPDAYYMTMNVFNSAGTAFLGPEPFAFDRAKMIAGQPATFVTTTDPAVFAPANDAMLPRRPRRSIQPPGGRARAVPDVRHRLDLEALALPRRLRGAGQLHVRARRQPHPRRLHGAVPVDAGLRAAAERAAARRDRRPRHVPARVPALRRRPRGACREPDGLRRGRRRDPLVRDRQRDQRLAVVHAAEHLPARHDVALAR